MIFLQSNGLNGTAKGGMAPVEMDSETSFINKALEDTNIIKGSVAVEYETREGSGKVDKDFKYTQGKLVSTK